MPLLTYLEEFEPHPEGTTVFDRVIGNAAALLLVALGLLLVPLAPGRSRPLYWYHQLGMGLSWQPN